ncbi:CRISPR-associated helicase Cas3 family protein protein [Candidatus Protofrankia datiscae]|uniref:CRISPR-associated helicase Cas3 family protein protein n=1 Tax=Candidatus Protofrankia datiscae TaxID=2716812 RepID=F8B328_9ACTN|nr:CRISPR-associated helicase Cas3 family protein protein [Candidatus Protofrankia datiscae]
MDGSIDDQISVDLNLWGKSKGLPGPYPLICHLMDSGAAATVLWRDYVPESLRSAVARGMETDISTVGRLIAF